MRGKITYARGMVAGACLMYGALYALGIAPLYFGPERRKWSRAIEEDPVAMKFIDYLEKHGQYIRFRPRASNRNFLETHNKRRVSKAVFINLTESVLAGVIKFGPDTEGPPRCVHGGCSAAVVDACLGILAHHVSIIPSVTANLSVNYRKKIPLGSAVGVECKLIEKEGRKSTFSFQLFQLTEGSCEETERVVFVEGTALFLQTLAILSK